MRAGVYFESPGAAVTILAVSRASDGRGIAKCMMYFSVCPISQVFDTSTIDQIIASYGFLDLCAEGYHKCYESDNSRFAQSQHNSRNDGRQASDHSFEVPRSRSRSSLLKISCSPTQCMI